jgi:hypothetical protein
MASHFPLRRLCSFALFAASSPTADSAALFLPRTGAIHVTLAHYDLVRRPRLAAVARDELPLLDPAIDVFVCRFC